MRSDELYLRDMLLAANDAVEFLDGYDLARFLDDRVMQRAILQALTEVGEAASHISDDLKGRYPVVPWDDARAFRNFAIEWSIVWDTATTNVRELQPQITALLAAEFPETEEERF